MGFGGWSAFFRQFGRVGEIRIQGPVRFWWVLVAGVRFFPKRHEVSKGLVNRSTDATEECDF